MKNSLAALCLFVGIVWSISIAFLVLENAGQQLLDLMYRLQLIPDELAMPTPSPEAAAKCATALNASGNLSQDQPVAELNRQARFLSWMMGYKFGFAVGLERARLIDQIQRNRLLDAIEPIGQALGAPTPSPPSGTPVKAIPEFGQLIEDDSDCTAAFLDYKYGDQISHLYKFGALTSFAVVYRVACPQCGTLFGPQIRHHGRETGIPEDFWQPLIQPPSDDASAETRQQKVMGLIQDIEEAIKRID